MSKTTKIVLGLVAGLFVLGALVSAGGSSPAPVNHVTPDPVVSAVVSECTSLASEYSSLLVRYRDAVSEAAPYANDPSITTAVVSTGRKVVSAGRSLIAACPQLAGNVLPSSSDLDSLENALDQVS